MHGDAGRDADRGCAFGCVLGAEQLVGDSARGRAVTGQGERIGQPRAELRRSRICGRTVKPCCPCGLAVAVGREICQRVGQPVVTQAVLGHS